MLYRKFIKILEDWYNSNNKKALFIDGARQIGKTTLVREFAKKFYEEDIVEINFITTPSAKKIFQGDISAQEIIDKISLFSNRDLKPGKTLIFFDEVQECDEVRTAIKFLVEDNRFDYIESGSLLGVVYAQTTSFAVGFEEIHTMYPMDFEEFAIANDVPEETFAKLKHCYDNKQEVDSFTHDKMMKLFGHYTIIGGMPACVQEYVSAHNFRGVINKQKAIVDLYKLDITKYDKPSSGKIQSIFSALPSELNDENKRFVLADISPNARTERYQSGFNWLADAGVALPCYNISEVKQPVAINAKKNIFKLFASDSGLLCAMCSDDIQFHIISGSLDINNGSIMENVMATSLKSNGFKLYYFSNNKIGEVDFIIEQGGKLIPIEVKSGNSYTQHRALDNLMSVAEYKLDEAIVLCKGNVAKKNKITYLPLYMIMYIVKDIGLLDIQLDKIF